MLAVLLRATVAGQRQAPLRPGPPSHLQVFTACANSFAHGSNDVANSIGPYAAIYAVWQTSSVASEAEVPTCESSHMCAQVLAGCTAHTTVCPPPGPCELNKLPSDEQAPPVLPPPQGS